MEHDPNKYHKLHLHLQAISCQYSHHGGLLDFAEISSDQIIYFYTLTSLWGLCFVVSSGLTLSLQGNKAAHVVSFAAWQKVQFK